jgi:hypothetical protein
MAENTGLPRCTASPKWIPSRVHTGVADRGHSLPGYGVAKRAIPIGLYLCLHLAVWACQRYMGLNWRDSEEHEQEKAARPWIVHLNDLPGASRALI